METKKYEVTIQKAEGSCKNTLFEKMAKRGDIQATKISEIINEKVSIKGYAICNIVTDDKDFIINYFDTEELGLISSGSEIFADSVFEYFGEVKRVQIVEVKTKKGKTYKAVPVLSESQKEEKKEETTDDLPF